MKKVISILLVMAMLTAILTVSFNALSVSDLDDDGVPYVPSAKEGVEAYEAETGEEVETQRIFFQMPNGKSGSVAEDDVILHRDEETDPETGEVIKEAYDEVVIHAGEKAPTWYNDYNVLDGKHYAGIYWWGGTANKDGQWVGYRAEIADEAQGIYYADVPIDVTTIIWNNGVDGGTDSSQPIYYLAAQTVDTNSEGAYPGDYDTLPYGAPDPWYFNNCIYVIDPDQVDINEFSQKQTCGANWYVYYGDGCYGAEYPEGFGDDTEYPDGTPGWSENVADICQNPDHFKNGVHVGYQPDEDPTEPAPEPVVIVDKTTDISVEGIIDAQLVVEALDPTTATFVVSGQLLALYDITLQKDGVDVQPDGAVKVKIPSDDPNAKIYRAETDGTMTDMNAVYENGYYVFTTNHFSVYAVVSTATPTEPATEPATEPSIVLDPNKLYFDTNGTGWEMGARDKVAFHIFGGDLENGLEWGAKKSQGTATVGADGVFEIDPVNGKQAYTLNPGVQYKIIFTHVVSNNWKEQTYDLLFTTDCFGHIAYCDGTVYENPVDSSKKTLAAFWKDMDASLYGPVLQISSIGNVVGTCPEEGRTPESIFNDFLTVVDSVTGVTTYANAYHYTVEPGTKTEQKMIDDIGAGLGLTKQQVYDAFTNNEVETTWDYTVSTLPGDVVIPTEPVTEPETEPVHVHTPGQPVQENVKPATCTAEGSYDEVVYCTECGEELSRTSKTIDKTPHQLQYVAAKEATATADGWKAHYKCSECNKLFSDATGTQEVIWDQLVIKYVAPTQAPTDPPTEPVVTGTLGDADGNGVVDIVDVTFIQRADVGIITPDAAMIKRGDVDKNNKLEILDATRIQRWLVDIDEGFGIGKAI